MQNTNKLIEAYIFWKNEPVSRKELARVLDLNENEIDSALGIVREDFKDRGIVLVENNDEVCFGASPEAGSLIEKLKKEELSKELSKATLETLSIIIYKGPIKRSEIEYIRGVNSQFILRHLEIRGLITKNQSEKDGRSFIYTPSFELLSYLGITKPESMPEYETLRKAVEDFEAVAEASAETSDQSGT